MACQIIYKDNSEINFVLDKQGNESVLYNALKEHPMIDDALKAYTNFEEQDNETEYTLTHKVGESYYTSYADALKNTNENQDINVVFKSPQKEINLTTIRKTTDVNTKEGFINFNIQNNLISDKKINGKLQGYGQSEQEKLFNTQIVEKQAVATLGRDSFIKDYYSFNITEPTLNKAKLTLKNGEQIYVDSVDIDDVNIFENKEEAIFVKNYKPVAYRNLPKTQTDSEETLQLKLMDILNRLGVSVMSISDYVKRYNIKNGVNPSARALADIANRVVALEDTATFEDFVEEVAHFIESATAQEKKENILRSIHKTAEYGQYAEAYKVIYSEDYSGEELENVVRREVLGKVIKNSILDNSQRTETEKTILRRAYDLIIDFVNSLKKSKELLDYLNEINNTIEFNDDSFVREENIVSLYTFFSINKTPIQKEIKKILNHLSNVKSSLPKTDTAKIAKVESEIENGEELSSIVSIVEAVNGATKKLEEALKDSEVNEKDYVFTIEETNLYWEMLNLAESLPIISESVNTNKTIEKGYKEVIVNRINEVKQRVDGLKAKKLLIQNETVDRAAKKLTALDGNEKTYEWYKNSIERAITDGSMVTSLFGTLANSSDGGLGLLGHSIACMTGEAHRDAYKRAQEFTNKVEDLGFKVSDVSKFNDGSYILSNIDHKKRAEDNDKAFVQSFREVVEKSDLKNKETLLRLSDKDIISRRNNGKLDLDSTDVYNQILVKANDLQEGLDEKSRTEEFYKSIEERYEKVGIGKNSPTRTFLSDYLSESGKLRKKATTDSGIVDYTLLSLQDRSTLIHLQESRAEAKNFYNMAGELKDGIKVKGFNQDGSLEYELDNNASTEAIVAFELTALDKQTVQDIKTQRKETDESVMQRFIDSLKGKSREEQKLFIELNANIGFNEQFYNDIKIKNEDGSERESLYKRMLDAGIDEEEVKKLAEINNEYNAILKSFTNKNNPTEIRAEDIPQTIKDRIIKLDKQRTDKFFEVGKLIGEQDLAEQVVDRFTETNESFNKEFSKFETKEEQLKFLFENMSDENAKIVRKMEVLLDDYIKGNRTKLPNALEKIAEKEGLDTDSNTLDYSTLLIDYAKTKILPYYKRVATSEYKDFIERLGDSSVPIEDLLNEIQNSEYLRVSPNTSFYTKEDDNTINPNYKPNYKMGWRQPKEHLYRNEKFYNTFGKNVQLDEQGFIIVETSSNKKLAELYNITLETHFKTLEKNGMSKGFNFYIRPQTRSKGVERFAKLFNKENIKGTLKDTFTFTEDDMIQGDNSLGSNVKVLPKMYTRVLEDEGDLTDNLYTSMIMQMNEASLRESRIKHLGEINAIMEAIQTREQYKGKPYNTTNSYKQAMSAIDYAVYGKKQEFTLPVKTAFGTFDIVKTLQTITNITRFKNLAFSFVIPATAYGTAKATQITERFVGQYFEINTYALANKEWSKHRFNGMKEAGKINQQSYGAALGRYFGGFDADESIHNSNYGFLMRAIPRTSMMLYSAAMYDLFGKNTMYALKDHRIVDGVFLNFAKFKSMQNNRGKTEKEISELWKNTEDKTIDKYFTVEKGIIKWNEQKLSDDLVDYSIDDIENSIRLEIKNLNIRIDNQLSKEDKVLAQRHGLWSLLMTHRPWLVVATENRFKAVHHNAQTNMWEEGSYRSMFNFFGGVIREWRQNGHKVMQAFKTEWDNAGKEENSDLTMLRRKNLKRVGMELAFLNTLAVLSFILRGFADDDDNKDNYALQMVNLLLYRTVIETNSASVGIPYSYTSVLDQPMMAWNAMKDLSAISNLFDSSEINTGSWSGYTKQQAYLMKNLPMLKHIKDAGNPFDKYNTIRFFTEERSTQMNTIPAYWFVNKEEE